jgi:hypothetical protein
MSLSQAGETREALAARNPIAGRIVNMTPQLAVMCSDKEWSYFSPPPRMYLPPFFVPTR